MSRSVPEWVAKHDDQAIPPAVRARVFARFEGYCPKCTRELRAGHWQCDHIVPLILGGRHAESNLQPLCTTPCHSAKTLLDVKLKAKVARVQKKHQGIRKRSTFACSRDSRWKKKIDGTVVARTHRSSPTLRGD
jgi:5-methylcytosine-specific restriction protein A